MRRRHDRRPDSDGDAVEVLAEWIGQALEDIYDRLEALEARQSAPNAGTSATVVVN